MEQEKNNNHTEDVKLSVGPKAFLALIVAILFFSGVLSNVPGMKWLGAFDFTVLSGKYGTIKTLSKDTFIGAGGLGARAGFLFALSLTPAVMLALGCIEVLSHYGAIRAAQKLLTPLLKPILDVPGRTGLALITDLQSTDAGAALTKGLYDDNLVTKKELVIISAWQYSGAGLINNYFSIGAGVFASLTVPLFLPLLIMFVFKFIGAIFVRIVLNTVYKEDFKDEQA